VTVSDRLAQSRAFHNSAKLARRAGRVDDALSAIQQAYELRQAAHQSDPDHLDQAWAEEPSLKFHHDALLVFYQAELSKDVHQEREVAKSRREKGLAIAMEAAKPKGGVM